jgi:hypothetical protein
VNTLKTIKQIQAYAAYAKKAVVGASTGILAVVAATHPAWSAETGTILTGVVLVLGTIAQFKVTNAKKPKAKR